MGREAATDPRWFTRCAAALVVTAVATAIAWSLVPLAGYSARAPEAHRHLPYPRLAFPVEISGSQYIPLKWTDIPGWIDDDHLAAYQAFRSSCKPIAAQHALPARSSSSNINTPGFKPLGVSLREPCRAARAAEISDGARARAFFEEHFTPLQISRLGEGDGFVTGYYEPILEGSRTESDTYNVPVYRRPSNLFVRGFTQSSPDLPNKGQVFRKIGRRKLVPYYDRAQIEDGAIAGRGLEICWLKNQTDLLFAQIQGSARILLQDGSTIRINYDAHNGYPYTAVGRVLIDRGIIPKDQMSMQKIRDWMDQNPDGANELRRQNRSYVFFRQVQLSDKDEAVGAQGVPLTPGRSIAVDKSLHVYGTPFFIAGELPIESEKSKTPFRRLMIAQDTGSAITGPARADLYFGAGADAGKVSGRLRHNMRFMILVPKSLDPAARGRKMPLPEARPSEKIARLFPQAGSAKEKLNDTKGPLSSAPPVSADTAKAPEPAKGAAAGPAQSSAAVPPAANSASIAPVPLPEPRPALEPVPRDAPRRHHLRGSR